jgi:hypothetical protein
MGDYSNLGGNLCTRLVDMELYICNKVDMFISRVFFWNLNEKYCKKVLNFIWYDYTYIKYLFSVENVDSPRIFKSVVTNLSNKNDTGFLSLIQCKKTSKWEQFLLVAFFITRMF